MLTAGDDDWKGELTTLNFRSRIFIKIEGYETHTNERGIEVFK
jgi:hypothetical protein